MQFNRHDALTTYDPVHLTPAPLTLLRCRPRSRLDAPGAQGADPEGSRFCGLVLSNHGGCSVRQWGGALSCGSTRTENKGHGPAAALGRIAVLYKDPRPAISSEQILSIRGAGPGSPLVPWALCLDKRIRIPTCAGLFISVISPAGLKVAMQHEQRPCSTPMCPRTHGTWHTRPAPS